MKICDFTKEDLFDIFNFLTQFLEEHMTEEIDTLINSKKPGAFFTLICHLIKLCKLKELTNEKNIFASFIFVEDEKSIKSLMRVFKTASLLLKNSTPYS